VYQDRLDRQQTYQTGERTRRDPTAQGKDGDSSNAKDEEDRIFRVDGQQTHHEAAQGKACSQYRQQTYHKAALQDRVGSELKAKPVPSIASSNVKDEERVCESHQYQDSMATLAKLLTERSTAHTKYRLVLRRLGTVVGAQPPNRRTIVITMARAEQSFEVLMETHFAYIWKLGATMDDQEYRNIA